MISISNIFNLFTLTTSIAVIAIILTHILSRLFAKKEPVKLDKNSFVVITGACIGIGRQMVLELARIYHCRILIIDVKSELFDEISTEIAALGGSCQCRKTDLSDKQAVEDLINFLLQRNQKIDLFIYNAGILCSKKTWEITQKQHEMVMRVNYFTPTIMIKKLEGLLSHIAVTGSMTALIAGGVNVSIYASSKHAIVSYMSSLRQQYKKQKKNITVSIGCPYAINTTMLQGFKTRLDFLFRILDQKYVGQRLIKQYIEKKQVCYIYEYQGLLFRIIAFLPTSLLDFCALKLDVSTLQSSKMLQEHEKKE